MPDLLIKFGIHIHEQLPFDVLRKPPNGPLFTKWLPNGEADAIALKTNDSSASLRVWFRRHGVIGERGLIEFEWDKWEGNEATISKQGILDAGPLYGKLQLTGISDETLQVLIDKDEGNPAYLKLGKKVIDILFETVERFLMILRECFGQYWIRRLEKWDSRTQSLGGYCFEWFLFWSSDGNQWEKFTPDKDKTRKVRIGTWGIFPYDEFLTHEDWLNLPSIVESNYSSSVSIQLIRRCYYVLLHGDSKYALIEGISSLELALEEFVRTKCDAFKTQALNQKFKDMHKSGKLALVCCLTPGIEHDDIDKAIKAIEARNAVIHDGADAPADTKQLLQAVIRIVKKLLAPPAIKFPAHSAINNPRDLLPKS